jgi:site-specific DNA-methyltransferase (adenine-specific)
MNATPAGQQSERPERSGAAPRPYYADASVTLYHGDCRAIMPLLPECDAVITDPNYGETSLDWDRWVDLWPALALAKTRQLWCFGSTRMFWDRRADFFGWKLAQDIVWEKHNGSGSAADRFRRVHEMALHFYQGEWGTLYHEPVTTPDATKRTVRRKNRPPHWGDIGAQAYASEDGGPRLMRSVIYVRSCHGHAQNETEKPEGIVRPLVEYSVPPGGLVIDMFAGHATTLLVARQLGRRAIGIELREEQCEKAARRLSQGELFGLPSTINNEMPPDA